jgi:hypothetical protein
MSSSATVIALSFSLLGAAALAGLLLRIGQLSLQRDALFLIVYIEVMIYVYIAPLLSVTSGDVPSQYLDDYSGLSLATLPLFTVPLTLTYLYVRSRLHIEGAGLSRAHTSARRLTIFSFMAILWSILYVALLATDGLLFRRIGFEGLVAAYGNLSGWQFVVIRGFDRVGGPMAAILLLALILEKGRGRPLILASFAITAGSVLVVAGINSRLGVLLGLITIGVPALLVTAPSRKRRSAALWSIFGSLLAIYLIGTVVNVRADAQTVGLDIRQFNPLYHAVASQGTSLEVRLDCVDLMARITPAALDRGFSWGASWVPGIVSSAGPLISADAAQAYKQTLSTSAKYYLMRQYANLSSPDYPSCALTDAYGNLAFPGFVVAGLAFGALAALATTWISNARRSWQIVAGIFLLADVAYFEGEFIGLIVRIAQALPIIVALALICPVAVSVRHRRGSSLRSGAPLAR